MTPDAPEPRYAHFFVRYPGGAAIESYCLNERGGTVREVQTEHLLAVVDADEDSRVSVEADRT